MAISRGLLICCLGTLLVCSFFIRLADADHTAEECRKAHPDDHRQCAEEGHDDDDDDDFDDTYKIVNKIRITEPPSFASQSYASASDTDGVFADPDIVVMGH